MKLVIQATNIHQGGGRALLLSLLSALRQSAVVLVDERMTSLPNFDPNVQVIRVAPSIVDRLKAEYALKSLCERGDTLLCFGNLPPLFPCRGNVFVYLQNRYLLSHQPLSAFPWHTKLRILFERLWLRSCLRNSTLLVQTESMALNVRQSIGRDCQVLPFIPSYASTVSSACKSFVFDYLYVASGEPHKNHYRLVDAWVFLASNNCCPSLCLTLDRQRDASLCSWIEEQVMMHGLRITNQPVPYEEISGLYAQSSALIYPSLFESFGLPLLEARIAGLPIIASERDYVRDVVQPADTFDPESALSIARAVLRHQNLAEAPSLPVSASCFLQQLEKIAEVSS